MREFKEFCGDFEKKAAKAEMEKEAIKSMQSVLKITSPIRKGMGPGMKAGQKVKGVASPTLKQMKV